MTFEALSERDSAVTSKGKLIGPDHSAHDIMGHQMGYLLCGQVMFSVNNLFLTY